MFDSPTLIVNETICRKNIQTMVEKCCELNVKFRPHFKTHQSHEVGRWFRDCGVDRIAVSSVPMAEYFASDNWNDITIAFPFVKQQALKINQLSSQVKLNLLVSSLDNAKALSNLITSEVDVLIEIDSGQGRSGVMDNDHTGIERIIEVLLSKRHIHFCGFLTHAGHSYHAIKKDLNKLNTSALDPLKQLKERWIQSFPYLTISYGDTPTSVVCSSFVGIDELRPGNFVFFDMQQASKGICITKDIAIAMACPLVAVYPKQSKAIIWGGAIHLSKDFYIDERGQKSYGAICTLNPNLTWSDPIEDLYIESLSQEHGVIRAKTPKAMAFIEENDCLAILPAHSCLSVDSMRQYWIARKGFVCIMDR
jgi:D-serine deaminase-like pyridoxal phosphate-dependent protein